MNEMLRLPRVQLAIKGLLLFGLGIFLLTRITSGTLNFYISQRFGWLTILAVLGLLLVGGSYQYLTSTSKRASTGEEEDSHQHSHNLGCAGLLLILLPIILGLVVPPRPLGIAALENREISVGSLDSVLPAAVRSAQDTGTSERSILDWVLAFSAKEWPSETDSANVTGFVYRSDDTDEDSFIVTRFVIGCCAADATAVGLTVQWPAARELVEGEWVQVYGQFAAPERNEMPVLVAEQVQAVPEPNQPYLYP